MPEQLFKPFKGRSIRLLRLVDDCCELPAEDTADSIIVLDVFTILSASSNTEDGTRAFERKANGDICLNQKERSILQDLSLALTLCQVSASTVTLLTGWPAVHDADGNVVGFDILEGESQGNTSMEIWSGVGGVDCGEGAKYGYAVFPCTYDWQISDAFEFAGADSLFDLQLTGFTNGNHAWNNGPFPVQLNGGGTAAPLHDAIENGVHGRVMVTDVPPPPVTNGLVIASAANQYLYGPDSI
jgi:hypothetical protein